MSGRDLRLVGSELRLALGRRRNQAGLLVLAAVPIVLALALRASTSPGRSGSFYELATTNGFFVAVTALSIEITLFLPLAIATLSGDAIAGEAQAGTLRYLLTVPVGRVRLLATKYVVLVVGGIVGAGLVALTGLLAGLAAFGGGPVMLLSGGELPFADALGRLALIVAYVAAGLAALAAIGLFVSTLTDQPIAVIIAVTLVTTTMWVLSGVPQLAPLHPWLLVTQWPAFSGLLSDPVDLEPIRRGLLVDAAYAVVFLLAAWARFSGRDITA